MKLTFKTAQFKAALDAARSAAPSKSTISILNNVKLVVADGMASLTGTDTEISVRSQIPAPSLEEIEIALPAAFLSGIISNLEGDELSLEFADAGTTLLSGRSKYKVLTAPGADFPIMPDPDGTSFTLPGAQLASMLNLCLFAVAQDETRSLLKSIYWEHRSGRLRLVSTDTHRLSMCEAQIECEMNFSTILPTRGMKLLAGLIDDQDQVTVEIGDSQAAFTLGTTRLTTRLLDGTYPNYQKVIPKIGDMKVLRLPTLPTGGAIRRVRQIFGNQDVGKVQVAVEGDTMLMIAQASDGGTAREEITLMEPFGEKFKIAVDSKYVAHLFAALDCKQVELFVSGLLHPILWRPDGDPSFQHVIMPMQWD